MGSNPPGVAAVLVGGAVKINGEEVEPVAFVDLQLGDIVYVDECDCGKRWCRGMLVEYADDFLDGKGPGWVTLPNCSAPTDEAAALFDTPGAVFYRVIDQPMVKQTTTRKKEAVR